MENSAEVEIWRARLKMAVPLRELAERAVEALPLEATEADALRQLRALVDESLAKAAIEYSKTLPEKRYPLPLHTPNRWFSYWAGEMLRAMVEYMECSGEDVYSFTPSTLKPWMQNQNIDGHTMSRVLKDVFGLKPVRNGSFKYYRHHKDRSEHIVLTGRGLFYTVDCRTVWQWKEYNTFVIAPSPTR